MRKKHNSETKLKISSALKGKPKPPRSLQHRISLSTAMSKSYAERFGKKRAKIIIEKIKKANLGKKRIFKDKEKWKKNLSNSLKGRIVWNKGKKGLQKAWNKIKLPDMSIIKLYSNQNLSPQKIANKFNVSRSAVERVLKENNVKMRGFGSFTKGKSYEELYGKDIAKKKKEKLAKALKGNPTKNWSNKISAGIKRYYARCEQQGIKISRIRCKLSKERRLRLSWAHKKYIKEHPEELERLKKIQFPKGISKIEKKFLDFLKKKFKEKKDFFFDEQDKTGKTFYRPDFQFPEKKVIIELDGYYKHFTKDGYKKDRIREYYLKKAGWKIFRFNFYDIDRNYKFEKVKNKVIDVLRNKNVGTWNR
ncbi:MAG: DUF559 domain-containing protein [Candidatus Pacearchaeota archaeon]|nr:DUF559 domain-containing protein [Candidatus Pacearchaeota archaeon]